MATKVELFLDDTWTDITSYVRQDPGLDITFGVQAEGGTADAATCMFVVNNADGRFTPRNTAGAYYPNLKRNTPARFTVGTTVRFIGEISEFPSRWDESGNNVWAPLTASGILRRLQHGSSLASTLTTTIVGFSDTYGDITGYWPCEDGPRATSLAAAVGTRPGTFRGTPVLGSVDLGVGTHNVPTWGGAAASFGPDPSTSTEFTAGFYMQLPPTGALTGGEEIFRVNVAGSAQSWRVLYSPGTAGALFLQVIASDGTTELLASSNIDGLDGNTFYVKLEVANSGSDVAWSFGTLGFGTTLSGSISAATVGAPVAAYIGAGTIAIPDDAPVAIGHVVLGDSDTALLHSDFDSGLAGYAGESVNTRLVRLASQYGITINVTNGTASPTEMGAQPDGTLLDVLRATEKADGGGILRDSINEVSLTYITRNARYNDLQPLLTLDYSLKQIIAPLEPTDDDQNLRNDVTVNRVDGSSARATLASGALSILDYPDGVGPYPFEDTYATYSDDALPYLAQWLLALGTVDETRWPAVTVDLIANPTLVTDAEAIRPGCRLRIENLPAYAGVTDVDLQVIGWRETITAARRNITFICQPGSVWTGVFELDDTVFGTLDDNRLGY